MTSPVPLVSIVVPAFNAAGTIRETVNSVLAQTHSDFELIVCDDASADDTAGIVRDFGDQRIRVLRNETNAGEGVTRDRAIYAARGKWLAVLDADDAWMPDRLERLLEASGGDEDLLIFDDLMISHHTDRGMVPWRPMRGRNAFETFGHDARDIEFVNYLRAERLLIKPLFPSRIVFDNQLRHSTRRFGADSEYFIRLGALGLRFRYLPEPLYLYRVTPGSATAIAKGAHQMRECIEDCTRIEGLDPAIHNALQDKIASLRKNEYLYAMADRFKRGDVVGCLAMLLRNPSMFTYAPRRVLRHFAYQLHRIRHSGSTR